MFQVFRLFHTYAFKSHIISCLCGIVLVYFQGLVKGLPPLVIPWWSALEDLKQRFGTTDLEWTLVAKFQRDGEPQGPQRRRDLRRPAGPETVGGGGAARPEAVFLPPWCLCPWFQGRHGGECLSVFLLLASFWGAFSCSLPLRHYTCRRTLNVICVSEPPFPLLQHRPSTSRFLRWRHTQLFHHDVVLG